MKLSDAKKILSGELEVIDASALFTRDRETKVAKAIWLTKNDVKFIARQLALKVTREKEKGK